MNAPIILAQLSGSQQTNNPSTPRNLKIEKPQNNQAVSIRLDGNTKLDFTDIASEKLTFVRVGEKLIVLFDNQSTVTIDPMFDSSGNALPNVSFEVGPDRIVDGTAFANLFPITTDQSVLPAAGAAAGGPAAGANFSDPNAGALGGSGARLALLGNEESGGGFGGDNDAANPQPIFNPIPLGNVDDEGLSEGNLGGPGDAPGNAITITNSLNVDFGTDRAGAFFLFSAAQPTLAGLTSGGQAIAFVILNNAAGGTPTLIGFIAGTDPTVAANQVFTVTLDNGPLNGAYTFTLLKPLDHLIANTEDTITLTFSFTATDGTGDTGTSSFGVAVNDDSPVLALGQQQATTVDEDGLQGATEGEPNGNPGGVSGDVAGEAVSSTGTLGVLWGADNTDTADVGGVQDGAAGGALTGRALFFTNATVLVNGVATALTSHGDTVTYALSNAGTTLTASAGGRVVFTVTLSDDGSGSYVFTLRDELDHPIVNTEDDLALQFNFTARDFDLDTIPGNFVVTVDDDTPIFGGEGTPSGTVIEDALPTGNPGDSYAPPPPPPSGGGGEGGGGGNFPLPPLPPVTTVATGSLNILWGADNFDTPDTPAGEQGPALQDGAVEGSTNNAQLTGRAVYFTNTTVATDLPAQGQGDEGPAIQPALTSRGEVVQYRLNQSGSMLIGFVPGSGGGDDESPVIPERIVFTIKLFDDGQGSYVFNLVDVLDHPVANSEDDIRLTFNITARDFDGDTATSTINITVNDDAPVQGKTTNQSVDEEVLNGGNAGEQGQPDESAGSTDLDPNPVLPVGGTLGVLWGADNDKMGDTLGDTFGRKINFVTAAGAGTLLTQTDTPTGADLGLGTLKSDGVELAYKIVQTTTASGDWDGGYQLIAYKSTGTFSNAADQVFTVTLDATSTNGSYEFNLLGNLDHPLPPTGVASQENDIDLTFRFRATDSDGDTGTAATFTVTVDDDAPLQVQNSVPTKVIDEDDLADFNPFYIEGVPVLGLLQGSLGTSPNDTAAPDQSITGLLGTVPVWGDLSPLVNAGADSALASFHLVSEAQAELLLQTVGPNGGPLYSHGDAVDTAQFVNIPGVGEILGFFASDGRLVAGLFVSDNGTYNFRLFDQIDHPVGDDPSTPAFESVQDVFNLDLSAFVQFSDGDGDTLTLKPDSFTVDIRDDAPIAIGTETGKVDEDDLADFNPLYFQGLPGFDILQGSLGTSPFDGFTDDQSITGLFGTVPVYGFLTDNIVGGADEFGKFGLLADNLTAAELQLMGLNSHGDAINHTQTIDIPGLGEAMGFFASDGRLVFGLFVSEGGFYNFRLFDQLDHAKPTQPADPALGPVADENSLTINLGKFVTFTDFDGDKIDLSTITFAITVVDDIPVLTGQSVNVSLDEDDLNNYLLGFGSAGTSPDADTDLLLLSSTGKQGFLNEIIGTNVVNGGADEFGEFGLVSAARANYLLTHDLAGWTSKGQAIDHVQTLPLGLLGNAMGFYAGDRLVFSLLINPTGLYDIRLWDQVDHLGQNGGETINLDLSKFVTYTDADGDTIDLGTNHLVLTVVDDAPEAVNTVVYGTVEDEQNDPVNALLQGSDLTHGNEDGNSDSGDDLDTPANLNLLTNSVTIGSIAPLVKVGADENGTFAFDTSVNGTQVVDVNGNAIKSHGVLVKFAFNGNTLIGFADTDNDGIRDSGERTVFTLTLAEIPPAGLLDGKVNDVFTFTLLDQIDHDAPSAGNPSTEDTKFIDLSPTIKFTDADGDTTSLAPDSFQIKVIDDTPIQKTGQTVKGTVEEEENLPAAPGQHDLTHGNEEAPFLLFPPSTPDGDYQTIFGFANLTTNKVSGNLSSLVSVGNDEVAQTLFLGVPIANHGNFALDSVQGLINQGLKSKGASLVYVVSDTDNDGRGDLLIATSTDGRPVFTLTITNTGTSSGSYTFTLLDQLDHVAGGGENILNIDFSSLIRFSDFDGDTITLTAGAFTIDVIDDQPVSKGNVVASQKADDEAQTTPFTGNNTPNDNVTNSKTVADSTAGALFSIGADDVGSITITKLPDFSVVYKANGFALTEAIQWNAPVTDSNGNVTVTAFSTNYATVATLTININGSYSFTVNAPVVHPTNQTTEENLPLKFEYTVTDFDQDSVSGTLTVNINDDAPTSKGDVTATQKADDEAQTTPFAGNDTPNDNVTNSKTVADATVGALFSAGSDGVQSITMNTFPSFKAVYKDGNGFAKTEDATWGTTPVLGDGTVTWTATGNTTGVVVATLVIKADGSYTFTANAPLVQLTATNNNSSEEDLSLKFSYTLKDGDNDTVTGSLTVKINDDTPISKGDIVAAQKADDEAQLTPFAGNDTPNDNVANSTTVADGTVGALFSAGSDGVQSITMDTFPSFSAIYKDSNGFAKTQGVTWGTTPVIGADGSVTWTATGNTNSAVVATLKIGVDGSYTFTASAPLVQLTATNNSSSEEDLDLKFSYTVKDGDNDTVTGSLTVKVNDDTPVSKGAITASTVVDDDIQTVFTGNDTPADGVANTNTATGVAGALFTAGADGVKSIALGTVTTFKAIYSDAGGTAHQESVSPGAAVVSANGTTTWNFIGGTTGATVATLVIKADGSYSFTALKPLVHVTNQTTEENLALTFNYTVTDGDNDTATGSLTVNVNDDTVTLGTPVPTTAQESALPPSTTTHGSLNVAFGADGPAEFVTGGNVSQTFNFTGGKNIDPDIVVTGNFVNTFVTGAITGSTIVFNATDSKPFVLTSINLGEAANPAFAGSVRLIGKDAAGNTIAQEIVAVGNVFDQTGITNTLFLANHPPFAGLALDSLTIQSVNLGFAHVDDLTITRSSSTGTAIIDGPVVFTSSTAITNVHILDDQNNTVNPATLTSNGQTIQYKLIDAVTLVGYVGSTAPTTIDSAGVVFSVVLSRDNSNPNGAYDFKLKQTLDDLPASVTDLKITFDFTAKDGDGDTKPGQFTVTVHDDTPTFSGATNSTVDEDNLSNGNTTPDGTNGDVSNSSATASAVSLGINWGADNNLKAENLSGGAIGTVDDPIGRTVSFVGTNSAARDIGTNTTDILIFSGSSAVAATLKSDGVLLKYDISYLLNGSGQWNGGYVLLAYKDGTNPAVAANQVFKVTIDPTSPNGSYTFELLGNLDHPTETSPGTENDIPLTFVFSAKDADGDSATNGNSTVSAFSVIVDDDTPILAGTPADGAINEAGIPIAINSLDVKPLLISFGADGPSAHLTFARDGNGDPLHPTGITSDDVPLQYAIRLAGSGEEQLVAFKQGETVNEPVFIVELTSPPNPNYVFTLYQNLDHFGPNDTSLALGFSIVATDRDGDSVTRNVTVNVADDVISVGAAPATGVVDEDERIAAPGNIATETGNFTFDFGNDEAGSLTVNPAVSVAGVSGSLTSNGQLVSYGFVGAVLVGYTGATVPSSITDASVVFSVELSTAGTGSYTFKLLQALDHSGSPGTPITMTFSVTGSDGDGDTAPTSFAIQVDPAGSIGSIHYDNLTTGVFVNLADVATTVGAQTVAANTATDNDNDAATVDIVGNDNVTGIVDANGGSGDDILVGGAEANILVGNGGKDILDGGAGNDLLQGNAGDDTFVLHEDVVFTGSRDIQLGDGSVRSIAMTNLAGTGDISQGGADFDTIILDRGTRAGYIHDTYSAPSYIDSVEKIVGTDGGDFIAVAANYMSGAANGGINIEGGAGNDFLGGGAGFDLINGGADNDLISGLGGDDALNGDAGNDEIWGGAGVDTVHGGADNDTIMGNAGNDLLFGDGGDDKFIYNPGNSGAIVGDGSDTVDGGAGTDTLHINRLTALENRYYVAPTGNAGEFKVTVDHYGLGTPDVITIKDVEKVEIEVKGNEQVILQGDLTGLSVDVQGNGEGSGVFLNGLQAITAVTGNLGAGNDEVYAGNHTTGAVIDGGDDVDSLHFELVNAPVNVDLDLGTAIRAAATDTFTNFENVTGTDYSDVLKGSLADNVINGGKGNDIIVGRGGADTLNGGEGNDRIVGGDEKIINGGFKGPAEVVLPIGSTTLADLGGGWTITGGTVDLLFVPGSLGTNFPAGVNAVDMRGVSNGTISQTFATEIGKTYTVTFLQAVNPDIDNNTPDSSASVTLSVDGGGQLQTFTTTSPMGTVWGNVGQTFVEMTYTFTATSASTTLDIASVPGNGNQYYGALVAEVFVAPNDPADLGDTINGGDGNDVIHGGAGADLINGDANDDLILGGAGDDTIDGGTGNDFISGGLGDDTISGGDGNDVFVYRVGDGNDAIDGGTETGSAFPNYDVLEVYGDGTPRTFTLGTITGGAEIGLAASVDLSLTYTGGGSVRADEVERVVFNVTGSDTIVIGDLTNTAISPNTIVINSTGGNNIIDLSQFKGTTVVVLDSDPVTSGDIDKVILSGDWEDYTATQNGDIYTVFLNGVAVVQTTNVEEFQFADGTIPVGQLVNVAPVAGDDVDTVIEAGGLNNGTPGDNTASGNVLDNDNDTNSLDSDKVVSVTFGSTTVAVPSNGNDATIEGTYGTLVIHADGSYTYTLNDADTDTNKLPINGSGTDVFTYTMQDAAGLTDTADLKVNVTGANDNPVAQNDVIAGGSGAIRVAVIGSGESDVSGTVGQLSDDTYFDFTATGYTFTSYATKAEWDAVLTGYDVVVIGHSGDGFDSYTDPQVFAALKDFADTGHGVVSTGWYSLLLTGNTFAGSQIANVDYVSPITTAGALTAYTSGQSFVIDSSHPITNGVSSILVGPAPGSFWEQGWALDANATSLAQQNAIAYSTLPSGAHLAYLGGIYLGATYAYDLSYLRSGNADRLLEQAANWAANVNNSAISEDATFIIQTSTLLANDSDVDTGDVLTVTAVSAFSSKGAAVTLNPNGTISYNPTAASQIQALHDGETTPDTFTYTVSDGHGGTSTATVTLTVTGKNDAPALVDDNVSVSDFSTKNAGNIAAQGSVLTNDSDAEGDTLSIVTIRPFLPNPIAFSPVSPGVDGVAQGTYGVLVIKSDGTYTYTANAAFDALKDGQTAQEVFKYGVDDGHGGQSTAYLTFNITGANDTPVAVADSNIVNENESVTANAPGVLANDTDADGDTLKVLSVGLTQNGPFNNVPVGGFTIEGTYGHLTIFQDGHYTYAADKPAADTIPPGSAIADGFTYVVTDSNGGTSSDSLRITVVGQNDAATITGNALGTVYEDGTLITGDTLTVNDVDTGQNKFQTPNSLAGQYGTFTFNADTGVWGYTLNNANPDVQALNTNGTLTDTLMVKSLDNTATKTISVTIQGQDDNHAPIVTPPTSSGSVTEDAGTVTPSAELILDGNFEEFTPLGGSPPMFASNFLNYWQATSSIPGPVDSATSSIFAVGSGHNGSGGQIQIRNPDPSNIPSVSGTLSQTFATVAGQEYTATFWIKDQAGGNPSLTVTATGNAAMAVPVLALSDSDFTQYVYHFTATGSSTTLTFAGSLGNGTIGIDDVSVVSTESVTGSFNFTDVDVTDAHTVSITPVAGGYLGTLTAKVTADTTGTGTGGVVKWDYTVADSVIASLGAADHKVQTYTVTVDDGHGGTAQHTVTVTLNGLDGVQTITNDNAYYAFVGTNPPANEPTTISFNANNLFGGGSDTFKFDIQNVFGSTGGLSGIQNNNTTGIVSGTPTAGLNVFRIDATDLVTGEKSFTYVAFSGLATNGRHVILTNSATYTQPELTDVVELASNSTIPFATTVSGGSGSDVVIGNNNNNTLIAASESDAIYGRGGNDSLNGGGVTSFLNGGDGNDTLTAGSSAGYLLGGAGVDTLNGSGNADVLLGGDGDDTINTGSGADIIAGGNGNDTINITNTDKVLIDGGSGVDTMNVSGFFSGLADNVIVGIEKVVLTGSGTVDLEFQSEGFEIVDGANGNNTLRGGAGNDIIRGGNGGDTIDGRGGIDLLDFSDASSGINVTLQQGLNTTFNTGGNTGSLGNDSYQNMEGIIGSNFDDTITGSAQNDVLRGGAGVDTINGMGGNDTLTGGTGGDKFTFTAASIGAANADTILDFSNAEGDKIDLSALLGAGTGALANGSNIDQYVKLTQTGSNVLIQVDTNGATGGQVWTDVATLQGYGTGAADIVKVVFQAVDHQMTV